jgi:hypothetical protein
LPSKYQLRSEQDRPWSSSEYLLPTKDLSPVKTKSFPRMKLDIQEISDDTVSVFLWNPDDVTAPSIPREPSTNPKYAFKVFSPEMFLEIWRRADNKTLLSTARGALIASKNYFEWNIYLGSSILMGFDELYLKEGHRILINNEHSSVVPYVMAFGR